MVVLAAMVVPVVPGLMAPRVRRARVPTAAAVYLAATVAPVAMVVPRRR